MEDKEDNEDNYQKNTLPVTQALKGIPYGWDWKSWYTERLANGAGLELFSQNSVTPDTTLILAGPPTMPSEGFTEKLSPIGLVTSMTITTDNQLRPMWELGTDRTYFTRGKAMHNLQIGAMVANKPSLLKLTSRHSPTSVTEFRGQNQGQFWMNLDTEATSVPFGMLVLFSSKGAMSEDNRAATPISAAYLEHCNISNFNMGMSNQDIVIQENIMIMFDRMISVEVSSDGT